MNTHWLRLPHPLCLGLLGLVIGGTSPALHADAPCGELDECRVLIEINATDGDIGFHVLFDAEGWHRAKIVGPDGKQMFLEHARMSLKDQTLTENFFESAEPVCEAGLVEEPDEDVVTLPEFLNRFLAGFYEFRLKVESGGELAGITLLTHTIPAAPADVEFDGSVISWSYGNDLGECTTLPEGFVLAGEGDIAAYEIVLEPDDDLLASFKFTATVPPGVTSLTVPAEYLAGLAPNTPLKVEVGAIERRPNGSFGNQTFSEEDGFCNNPDQEQCPEDD